MIKRIVRIIIAKVKFSSKCVFDSTTYISLDSEFEGLNKIYPHCIFSGSMGYGSYIGPYCNISAYIGRFTSIAPYVKTNNGDHPFLVPYVTTCPMFYSTQKQNGKTFANRTMYEEFKDPIKIGNDCWIGEGVFIAGGCVISDGAVVLAGAVVTKDVPPYAIVGGVPAKILKYRYEKEDIDLLLGFKWWERDLKWLKSHWELLCDFTEFKAFIENESSNASTRNTNCI